MFSFCFEGAPARLVADPVSEDPAEDDCDDDSGGVANEPPEFSFAVSGCWD